MPNKIRTETDDLLVLTEDRLLKFLIEAISITVIIWIGYGLITGKSPLEAELFFIAWTVFFVFFFGWHSLFSESVTIDKKSQSITVQKYCTIKRFESIKKIPFSDLKEVKVIFSSDETGGDFWIRLIQYGDKSDNIYQSGSESDANAIAKKIRDKIWNG